MKTSFNFPKTICNIVYSRTEERPVIDYIKDNKINCCTNEYGRPVMVDRIKFGNNCISGIEEAEAVKMQQLGLIKSYDNVENLLDNNTFNILEVGQKIVFTLSITNTEIKATIIEKTDSYIVVKKFRCKNQFYKIFLGQATNIIIL